MEKIKVLYIIDTLEGYGAEKSLVEITSNFNRIIPVFVHIYQGDMLKPRLEEAGIRVYSLDLTKKYAFNTAVKKLKSIYSQEQPGIVHATLFRSEIIARKLKRIFPQIYLVGSFVSNAYSQERFRKKGALDKFKLSYFQNLDKKTVPLVDRFISNSQTIKINTSRVLGIDPEKVKVIYRGRRSADFDPQKVHGDLPYLQDQSHVLLNVSRLIPLKGQLDLIKAMPQIITEYPQMQLVFAGHGSFRENLERQARKLGVQKHIRFLGRIDNIQKLLIKADVFLYPSYSEGLPGALIEAMMAGRIIIASDIPENLECVDENCALIYKKGNVAELAANILKVIKKPEKYQSLGENAQKKAIKKFELAKVVGEYEDFYLNAVVPKEKLELGEVQKKTLRILHLIQKPQNRGAETFASQLANHQNKQGNIVKLVSVFSGNANLPWKKEIESLDASSKLRFLDYKAWKKLNIIIEEFKPDIIQANAGDTLKYTVFSKKIFGWKPPIIFRNASEVGRYLKNNNQKRINSFFYQQIACVASVSKASKKDLIAHFPFLKNKTEVIPVGLERTSINTSFSFPQNQKNIIHVGGFSFEKNHQGLIRIFKGVLREDENVILHLVGDGPLRDSIEKEVVKQDLQDKIKFYGFVENALPMIAKADVLVLPSIIEGLPGVLLEAMYCETPVITNNVGGINEIVNADTGILIERDHEDEFSKAILQVLNENNSAQIQKARDLVLKNYMNESLVREFEALYKKVI
ncbi:glycosyltransferase [uncultured Salegentibacter sp.]|uniref:glycosyltransferase n=1 Tax=uncultured Salegentibacter sp. TaxID=259320 RepID=UPI002599A450|nr:glycosyltransferase [uncultured Salegentibacter sp.]